MNWVDAAKGKTAASCPFEYAAKLTEVMLLGVVALKAGRKIRVRRREHAHHQRAGREPVPVARAARGMVLALGGAPLSAVAPSPRSCAVDAAAPTATAGFRTRTSPSRCRLAPPNSSAAC